MVIIFIVSCILLDGKRSYAYAPVTGCCSNYVGIRIFILRGLFIYVDETRLVVTIIKTRSNCMVFNRFRYVGDYPFINAGQDVSSKTAKISKPLKNNQFSYWLWSQIERWNLILYLCNHLQIYNTCNAILYSLQSHHTLHSLVSAMQV